MWQKLHSLRELYKTEQRTARITQQATATFSKSAPKYRTDTSRGSTSALVQATNFLTQTPTTKTLSSVASI